MEISLENLYVDFGRIQTLDKGGGGRVRSSRPLDKGGAGGGLQTKFFRAFEPQFRLKIRGEGGPRAPPLDAPLFRDYR